MFLIFILFYPKMHCCMFQMFQTVVKCVYFKFPIASIRHFDWLSGKRPSSGFPDKHRARCSSGPHEYWGINCVNGGREGGVTDKGRMKRWGEASAQTQCDGSVY